MLDIRAVSHSQSARPAHFTHKSQDQAKHMHKICNCTMHGQIFDFFSISFHRLCSNKIGDEEAKSLSGALRGMFNLRKFE